MKKIFFISLFFLAVTGQAQTLYLDSNNPFYFKYKGKTTALIGSGEHYGAVMNIDFDYKKYLAQQKQDGLNHIRLFTGPYRENESVFGIEKNTMNPQLNQYLCAWERSSEIGGTDGNKFDLMKWDNIYFNRLRDFVQVADSAAVVVEITLFSSFYKNFWILSPFYPENNIQNLPVLPYQKVQTLDSSAYFFHQERYVRKIVQELNGFDNIYFEIQNEPWADNGKNLGVLNDYIQPDMLKDTTNAWRLRLQSANDEALKWQMRIAQIVREEEADLPKKHLISQNIGNFNLPLQEVDKNIDIINFHYALPQVLQQNRFHQKLVGFNETGFSGSGDDAYRRQAWRFMMSGGGLFSHLDYSFSVGFENGSDANYVAPGGGSPALRKQFKVLKTFLDGFDLSVFRPDKNVVQSSSGFHYAMSNLKTQWAIYTESNEPFFVQLRLPEGKYEMTWINAKTGEVVYTERFTHTGEFHKLWFLKTGIEETALKIEKMK